MDPRTRRRYRQHISAAQAGLLILTISLVAAGGVGVVIGALHRRWEWVVFGGLWALASLTGGLVIGAVMSLLRLLVDLSSRVDINAARMEQLTNQSQHQLDFLAKLSKAAERIERWSALSSEGRAVLAEPIEKEAIRAAFREACQREDWGEATRLIEGFETRYGQTAEAGRLRLDLDATRRHQTDERARAQIAQVRQLIEEDRFIEADRALMTLRERLPNDTRSDELAGTLRRARRRRRETLSVQWQQACSALDAATCKQLLIRFRELVSDAEMSELQETAATVERTAQRVLRDQFAEHVKAKRWDQAVRTGEEIVARYPGSPMAAEFEKIRDHLATRAAQEAEKT